jgi:hypothetical protein
MHTDKDRISMAAPPTNANLSTKAEEKRLRRSRRLAPKDDTNAPPEQFLEPPPSREDTLKDAKRERRRVRKFQKKQALQKAK